MQRAGIQKYDFDTSGRIPAPWCFLLRSGSLPWDGDCRILSLDRGALVVWQSPSKGAPLRQGAFVLGLGFPSSGRVQHMPYLRNHDKIYAPKPGHEKGPASAGPNSK
jgi:hypothetical protein